MSLTDPTTGPIYEVPRKPPANSREAIEADARRAVDDALGADPPDVTTLRRYAVFQFDPLCAVAGPLCGCAYCDARQALAKLGKTLRAPAPESPPPATPATESPRPPTEQV